MESGVSEGGADAGARDRQGPRTRNERLGNDAIEHRGAVTWQRRRFANS